MPTLIAALLGTAVAVVRASGHRHDFRSDAIPAGIWPITAGTRIGPGVVVLGGSPDRASSRHPERKVIVRVNGKLGNLWSAGGGARVVLNPRTHQVVSITSYQTR